jgi:hypothetical protein
LAGSTVAALVAGGLAGRYLSPTKVETRTVETVKTVEVERKTIDQEAVTKAVAEARASWQRDRQDHTVTRTVYVEGKVSERIVYRDVDTHAAGSSSTASATTATDTRREDATRTAESERKAEVITIRETIRPDWRLEAQLRPAGAVFAGASVSRRVLGPAWIGVWGRPEGSLGTYGLSVGVEF